MESRAGRILVCVSASPHSPKLIQAAEQRARHANAELLAVHIDTPSGGRLSASDRARVTSNLRFAEELGATTAVISAFNPAEGVIQWAREHHVTAIVLGKPTHSRLRDIVRGSFLNDVVRSSGDIDVYVVAGAEGEPAPPTARAREPSQGARRGYVWAAATVLVSSLLCSLLFAHLALADLILVYLLGVIFVSTRFGRRPSIFAAILSVLAFDFFFVPPYFTLAVTDFRHIGTFATMFLVAVITGTLTDRLRQQREAAQVREHQTASLYAMSRELGSAQGIAAVCDIAARHFRNVLGCDIVVMCPSERGTLSAVGGAGAFEKADRDELAAARWAWEKGRPAGRGTDELPQAHGSFWPLQGSHKRVGVLGVMIPDKGAEFDAAQRHLIETFSRQTASAIEREELARSARDAEVQVEAERLRSSLLSSVSHDLRTPLAVIEGSASTLLDESAKLQAATKKELLVGICEEARRLGGFVRNLLDITRLEAGAVQIRKEWQPIDEVIGTALARVDHRLDGRRIETHIDPSLPPVLIDGGLFEQVLVNLLENAIRYAPQGSVIDLSAEKQDASLFIEVADRGPGIAEGSLEHVFEKFYRGAPRVGETGVGLGLSICRAIVSVHGGRIWAAARSGGGAALRLRVPVPDQPSIETLAAGSPRVDSLP